MSYMDSSQGRYDAKNCIVCTIKLNRKTDADIIERLERSANRQGYIKSLIRADIAEERQIMKK